MLFGKETPVNLNFPEPVISNSYIPIVFITWCFSVTIFHLVRSNLADHIRILLFIIYKIKRITKLKNTINKGNKHHKASKRNSLSTILKHYIAVIPTWSNVPALALMYEGLMPLRLKFVISLKIWILRIEAHAFSEELNVENSIKIYKTITIITGGSGRGGYSLPVRENLTIH